MPAPDPRHGREPDPTSCYGLIFRILDRTSRTAHLLAIMLLVLGAITLLVLGVVTQVTTAGRFVGVWSLSGAAASVVVSLLVWGVRALLRRRNRESSTDLGPVVDRGEAEDPDDGFGFR